MTPQTVKMPTSTAKDISSLLFIRHLANWHLRFDGLDPENMTAGLWCQSFRAQLQDCTPQQLSELEISLLPRRQVQLRVTRNRPRAPWRLSSLSRWWTGNP